MRILVVEDESKLATALKRGLELQTYAVDVAYTGADGYDLSSTEPFDLIILDRMLPEMDGIEVCRRLREDKNFTPILMLTAKGLVTDRVNGLDTGADDYMVKPFSFEELFSRVRALARRSADSREPKLQLSDLTVDPASFRVIRSGKNIKLSSKEFSLLAYLLRHQGRVCSKDELLNHVWDYDANILPSTIEVHIKNLRDKIDRPFSTPLIHTVRGFGYKLSEET